MNEVAEQLGNPLPLLCGWHKALTTDQEDAFPGQDLVSSSEEELRDLRLGSVRKVTEPKHNDLEYFDLCWVTLDRLKEDLSDERVAVLSYAINISLALNFLEL